MTKLCKICGENSTDEEDRIVIYRIGAEKRYVTHEDRWSYNIFYHTRCFENVAGNFYVPSPRGD